MPGLALHYLCVDFILSCGKSARFVKNIYKEEKQVRAKQKPFLVPEAGPRRLKQNTKNTNKNLYPEL